MGEKDVVIAKGMSNPFWEDKRHWNEIQIRVRVRNRLV